MLLLPPSSLLLLCLWQDCYSPGGSAVAREMRPRKAPRDRKDFMMDEVRREPWDHIDSPHHHESVSVPLIVIVASEPAGQAEG